MITFRNEWFSNRPKADQRGDNTFGNILFFIASTIGIAVKNGYTYGFPVWNNQEYFVNQLPLVKPSDYNPVDIPEGRFLGFDIPDNSSIWGYMQSEKYFEHCEDIIRYYFTLKKVCEPFKDTILIHARNYAPQYLAMGFNNMNKDYYLRALKHLPDRRIIVVTDNLELAHKTLGNDFEYISNSPIIDFYLLANADYIIGSNSTFSWWGAWLSKAKAVFPEDWFPGLPVDTRDVNCKNWILC